MKTYLPRNFFTNPELYMRIIDPCGFITPITASTHSDGPTHKAPDSPLAPIEAAILSNESGARPSPTVRPVPCVRLEVPLTYDNTI